MAPMMQGTVAATKQTKDALRANAMDVDDMADIMDDTREEVRAGCARGVESTPAVLGADGE